MKRLPLIVSLLLTLFLIPNKAEASHMMGVDLTYECLNNCTIRVYLRAYRDCTGASGITNNITFNAQTPGCSTPTAVTSWSPQQTTEVTPLCPGAQTGCTNPNATINGVQEYYWFRDYDICSQPNCIFTISWGSCCRNGSITSGASNAGMGINSTTVNTAVTPCNSSPQFANPPVPYICAGQPYVFNQGAIDPEGDSLAYALGPCFTNANVQVTYGAGYSATQPLGATWNVQINANTGDITVTPQPGNAVVGVMCVYVEEWRNGQLINTIVRDIQMTVIQCPNNTLPSAAITNVQNGSGSGFVVNTCVGNNLCFDIVSTDPDTSQIVGLMWDLGITGATFTQTGNPSVQDTIIGTPGNPPSATFCWTPTANGVYSFLVTLTDDACPILGQNQFTIQIVVGSIQAGIQAANPGCGSVTLCAMPTGGVPPFTYQWTGTGGLSGNPGAMDSCVTHVYSSTGTYTYSLTITDSNGCESVDSGSVSVFINVAANAGPNVNFCSGGNATIGTPAQPNYSYSWTPVTGLASPSSAVTTVTGVNNGTTPIVNTYTVEVTDLVTTCVAVDTVLVTIWPQMVPSTVTTAVSCFGGNDGTATANVTGGVAPLAYQWDAAASNQATQTASNLLAGTYSVTVTDSAGCTVVTSATVSQPSQVMTSTSNTDASCFGGSDGSVSASASGGVGGFTFVWQPGNMAGQTIQNLQAGTYTVVATDANGCTATSSATVNEPTQLQIVMGSTPTTCALPNDNGTASVTPSGGTPGYTYLWSDLNAQTTQSAVGLAAGPYSVTVTDAQGCQIVGSVNVGEILPPTVVAGPDVTACEGEGGTIISASASGGAPGYYYTWSCGSGNCGLSSQNAASPNANPTTSQYYYVFATDTNGCTSNIDSLWFEVLPKPIVDAGPDLYLCGDSAPCQILNPSIVNAMLAPGPYTYTWFPAAGLNDSTIANPCARPDTTTTYTLVVTSGNGCTSDFTTTDTLSTVVVHVNPIPVANAGPDQDICALDSVQLQGFATGAGPGYDFEWSPVNGLSSSTDPNPMASPALTTTYTLVVWSNNCPSYGDPVVVNVHTLPTVDAGPDREICLGESTLIDAQAGGDSTATYSFNWWPNTFIDDATLEDPTVSPESTTMYYVQATTNFGCDSPVDSVLVKLKPTPIAEAGDNPTICQGNDYELQGSYSYTTTDSADPASIFFAWTPTTDVSDPTIPKPTVTPAQSGWYYFTVRTNTCSTTDSVFITVIPEIGVSVTADTTITCEGDSVLLTATAGIGGANFTWVPSAGVADPTSPITWAAPSTSTTYSVIATEGGCADTAGITIDILPRPQMDYLSSALSGCAPHEMSFMQSATGATFYIWNFGDGSPVSNMENPTHMYEEPGTYNVSLTGVSEGGCDATVSDIEINVVAPAVAEFTSDPGFPIELSFPNTSVQFTNESQNGVTYNWQFGDGSASGELNPSHVFENPGEYMVTLTVTNSEGCVSEVIHGPFVIFTPELFIPNVFSPNDDDINDRFIVNYSGSQPFNLQIFDRWGVKVHEGTNKNAGWNGQDMDGSNVTEGVYFYRVSVGDKDYAGNVTLVR